MTTKFTVGQRVRCVVEVIDPPQDGFPGCLCAEKGDEVVVRRVGSLRDEQWYSVSHPHRTDGATFSVTESEIEAV